MPSSADGPPEIGLTGARFGGPSRRRRARSERGEGEQAPAAGPAAPVVPPLPEPGDDGPSVGLTGARFGGASRSRRRTARPGPAALRPAPVHPAPAAAPVEPPPAPAEQTLPVEHLLPVSDLPVPDGAPHAARAESLVRPYVLTGGRTRARVSFAVEALVTATGPARPGEPLDHARIRELCRGPRSVAEVAALLGVPLGVAQVLLADMLDAGAVQVHRTADAGGPDLALMERVLSGLRRL
ncbi:DUF742 domain-containing protein [Pseudonocardia broussonetiae]|uniref:DUF742 domain-containing protein n=1 Tax=Pseudonocardia broussonetiae TaxID=2736640 RepID=A0A6M6JQ77_9PSEU|nr:DUF742 domain-containing protein [Pseudonocardia broussonetiae]QJY48742.1 DUF742 domain-containing protein [Pseudonocardia broussonetiae]